jgi:cysteine desulfurase
LSASLYLDHAATTPLLPAAREALFEGFALWANPSSPHRAGRAARAALEDARRRIGAALGWPGEVVLTSGASEGLALAMGRSRAPLAAVSVVEHEAVLRLAGALRGWRSMGRALSIRRRPPFPGWSASSRSTTRPG